MHLKERATNYSYKSSRFRKLKAVSSHLFSTIYDYGASW